ncbi:hypothetical protein V6N12_016136 [Hibiscus sabdariffa]|uniref:BED-type domain-containing protein n=1 Tax=Hibiscus sabdariffa TaxID=183260 RepID=A0ABR2C8T5_9ROSI
MFDGSCSAVDGGAKQVDATNKEEQASFTKRKRKKTSGVWEHFRLVKLSDGAEVSECIHCGEKINKLKDGTTIPLHRHIGDFPKLKTFNRAGGSQGVSVGGTSKSDFSSLNSRFGKSIKTDTAKYDQHIRSVDTFAYAKSELDIIWKDFTLLSMREGGDDGVAGWPGLLLLVGGSRTASGAVTGCRGPPGVHVVRSLGAPWG